MKDKTKTSEQLFSPVHLDVQCVLFFKTRAPIDPIVFVHRICEEIAQAKEADQKGPPIRRMRYVNRLTPMTLMGKATEKGLEEVADKVLREHFQMTSDGEMKKEEASGVTDLTTPKKEEEGVSEGAVGQKEGHGSSGFSVSEL